MPHVSMCNYLAVIACLGFLDDIAAVAANDILGRDLHTDGDGQHSLGFRCIPRGDVPKGVHEETPQIQERMSFRS